MKVIFLDIDGVINTDQIASFRRNHAVKEMVFDDEAMVNLHEIVASTGSRIVISSTWRIFYNTDHYLWTSLIDNLRKFKIDTAII